MRSIIDVPEHVVERLECKEAVEVFRDLLNCEAKRLGVPLGRINISTKTNIADGGIDASVDYAVSNDAAEVLCAGNTHYQIKAGTSAKPWQKSWVCEELFGRKGKQGRENLGEAVRRCMDSNERYVLVCSGADTQANNIAKAKETVVSVFEKCGYDQPKVEVWGCGHIVKMLSRYPSLCLKVTGRNVCEFQTHESWSQSEDMSLVVHLGEEQKQLIANIRNYMRGDQVRHVRLIGEPGIGKTRAVLEALRTDDLGALTIYVEHADDFQKSHLYNELLRADNDYYVILVIDECSARERGSIWNVLRNRSERCRLVTIDHGPEESADDMMITLHCPVMPDGEIATIIKDYVDSPYEAERWAPMCGGSPRVAHVIGQNLKRNPEDIFKAPATVDVWGRFIAGYDCHGSRAVQERLVVLRHIALFERFGFEEPVEDEAKFISKLVERVDPQVTWGKFQEIVYELKRRRILQGKTTCFIAPKALHIYLWLDFWRKYGIGSLTEFLQNLPDALSRWFMSMFTYAQSSAKAFKRAAELLDPSGPFSDESFLTSRKGCMCLGILGEAHPEATLSCLERTIGKWSCARLLEFKEGRQRIVWALEKIAVWGEYFHRAAMVLLKLAEAETANFSNNATGTFTALFSLAYGPMAPTEAPPEQRVQSLRIALESKVARQRELGLKACETALNTRGGIRMVGAEYQGLRPSAKLWMPKMWGEVFDAYRAVWKLVVEMHEKWEGEERTKAGTVLVTSTGGLVDIKALQGMVLDDVEELIEDSTTDLGALVNMVRSKLRYGCDDLDAEVVARLEGIDGKITGETFASKLRRFVLLGNWDDLHKEDGELSCEFDMIMQDLAREAVETPRLLFSEIAGVVEGDGMFLSRFGYELGKEDGKQVLLSGIIDEYGKRCGKANPSLLGGYLCAAHECDANGWEEIVLGLLSEDRIGPLIVDVIWRSGLTAKVVKELVEACKEGTIEPDTLAVLAHSGRLSEIEGSAVHTLSDFLAGSGRPVCAWAAVCLLYGFYLHGKKQDVLPEEIILRALTNKTLFEEGAKRDSEYYWHELASKLVDQCDERRRTLLKYLFEVICESDSLFATSHSSISKTIMKCIEIDPDEAWDIMCSVMGDGDGIAGLRIRLWLSPTSFGEDEKGPILLFRREAILEWVEEKPCGRAEFVAEIAPKTIESEGIHSLARELLIQYGDNEEVRCSLFRHFWGGGWCGSRAGYYRRKRDTARKWLENEKEPRVVSWVKEYIRILGKDMELAEIEEEREL